MGDVAKLQRDALFKKLRAKPENKVNYFCAFLRSTGACRGRASGLIVLSATGEVDILVTACAPWLVHVGGSGYFS